jgi:hypothetical protein
MLYKVLEMYYILFYASHIYICNQYSVVVYFSSYCYILVFKIQCFYNPTFMVFTVSMTYPVSMYVDLVDK